jgi:hypothetical protein
MRPTWSENTSKRERASGRRGRLVRSLRRLFACLLVFTGAGWGCGPLWVKHGKVRISARFYENGTCTVEANGKSAFRPGTTARSKAQPELEHRSPIFAPHHFELMCEVPVDHYHGPFELNELLLWVYTPTQDWPSPGTWVPVPATNNPNEAVRLAPGTLRGILDSPVFADDFVSLLPAGGVNLIPVDGHLLFERRAGDVFVGSAELVMQREWSM